MGQQLFAVVLTSFILVLFLNIRRVPAVDVGVVDGAVVVTLRGWDVLYCCRRRVAVPLDAVAGVCVSRRDLVPAEGMRLPGTSIRGVIRAGSYGTGAARDFWDVRKADEVLVIQMKPECADYRRIVLEVAEPRAEALRLRPMLGAAPLPISA